MTTVAAPCERRCDNCGRDPYPYTRLCVSCYGVEWESRQTIPVDVDEVAVLRAVAGDRLHLTRGERIEAVRILTERGQPQAEVAARLGIHERQVQRDRRALRLNGRLR